MKMQKYMSLSLLAIGLTTLVGCDGPSREVQYRSEYQTRQYSAGPYERSSWYDPTGDAAYSYYPVYSPVERPGYYTPGTPGYSYSYYYSDTEGD